MGTFAKRLAKIIAWIIGVLLATIIITIIVCKIFVNPDDYKGMFEKFVKHQTGHTLNIEGHITISYFPWIGLDMKDVTWDEPKANNTPILKVGEAGLKVSVLPLFLGHIKIKTVLLKDTTINLITYANGTHNWDSFEQQIKTTRQPKPTNQANHQNTPSQTTSSPIKLQISNVEIDNADIHVINQKAGTRMDLTAFNFDGEDINFSNKPFSIDTQFSFKQSAPQFATTIKASADVRYNNHTNSIALSDSSISGKVTNVYGTLKKPVNFDTSLRLFKLLNREFELSDFKAQLANLKLTANLRAGSESGLNTVYGNINVPAFNPNQLLAALNLSDRISIPLQKAALQIKLNTAHNKIILNPFAITLGKDNIKLNSTYFVNPKDKKDLLRFTLNANSLNLDRIIPTVKDNKSRPAQQAAPSTLRHKERQQSHSTQTVSNDWNMLNWQGQINIGQLTLSQLTFNQLKVHTTKEGNQFKLAPITAKLYGGDLSANATANLKQASPQYSLSSSISNMQLGQVFTSILHKNALDGSANFSTQITTSGNSSTALTQHLNGQGKLLVRNGKVFGFNLNSLVNQATQFLSKGKIGKPKMKTGNETDFSRLSGNYQIKNGVVNNNDLTLITSNAMANGAGQINLNNQTIDYQLNVGPLAKTTAQQPWNFPLTISGPLDSPKIAPNVAKIIGQVVQDAIKKQGKKVGKEVQQFFKGLFN